MPHPKIGKARTRFFVAAYIALQIAGAEGRRTRMDFVNLSDVRPEANVVQGTPVSGDRSRTILFSSHTASPILKSTTRFPYTTLLRSIFAPPSPPSRLKPFTAWPCSMPHPKIGKARTRFFVAAYIALQIAG